MRTLAHFHGRNMQGITLIRLNFDCIRFNAERV